MSSTRWFACTPPSRALAEGVRRTALWLALSLALAGSACSNFRSALPLAPRPAAGGSERAAVARDLTAAGVLFEREPGQGPAEAPAGEAVALAEALGVEASEPPLDVASLLLLLEPPASLAARSAELQSLRSRLGHRYAAVASRGVTRLGHSSTWDVILVIPTPWIFLWFNWPIPIQSPSTHPHDADVARIVDLDRAEIVAESFVVRRGAAKQKPYDRGQLEDAFEALGWESGR